MKKRVFVVVLVLCVVFSAVAVAENICTCNKNQVGDYSIGYDFRLKAEYGDFIIRIPSVFKKDDLLRCYNAEDCTIRITVMNYDYEVISADLGLDSAELKEVYKAMQTELFEQGEEYDLISVKDCPALVRVYLDSGYAHGLGKDAIHTEAEIYITNGRTTLRINMSAPETEILTKYLDGILSHIIVNAPEEE